MVQLVLLTTLCGLLIPVFAQHSGKHSGLRLRGATTQEEDGVLILTHSNFDEVITQNPLMLVKFFAPWCGHCRHFAPTYAVVAKKLKATNPKVPCGQVDVTVERDLTGKYNVQSYPTVKVFYYGQNQDFNGNRDADTIVDFALKWVEPPATRLDNIVAVENFVSRNSRVLLGFFKIDDYGGDACGAFKNLCQKLDQVAIGFSTNDTIWKKYRLQPPALAVLFSSGDPPITFGGDMAKQIQVEAFVEASKLPSVVPLDDEVSPILLNDGRPLLLLFKSPLKPDKQVEEDFKKASLTASRRVLSVIVDGELASQASRNMAEAAFIQQDDSAIVRILAQHRAHPEQRLVYKLETDQLSERHISSFVADFLAGNLQPMDDPFSPMTRDGL